jgi:2-polyprenyl-3-methyl-5-hydroxy-6-metoxy-1,4-benzoquinol methylase
MTINEIPLSQWHQEEEAWWNQYGEYMTFQWKLTPTLNKILKEGLEDDYVNFLFQPNEKLLDVGCGSGWLSMFFAERGMSVLGVDVSLEQINAANKLKQTNRLECVEFECCDLIQWDVEKYKGQFSSVFVSAFLHHLPDIELEVVMKKIETVLKPGGKVYLYEPMKCSTQRRSIIKAIDFMNNFMGHLFLNLIPKWFNLYSQRHHKEMDRGYQMCSPHERPVDVELLKRICADTFEIQEIKGRHLFSLGFAMQSMGLKDMPRKLYAMIAVLLFMEDRVLMRLFNWQDFSMPNRFILCSIKLIRK